MQLTKLEKAIVIGTILSAIKAEELKEYVDIAKLPQVIKEVEALADNTTRKAKKEADISLISKLIDSFLEEKKPKKVVQFRCISCGYTEQHTERKARTKDGLKCKRCKHGGVMINEGIQNQTTEA
ncbi:hypothetical protein [Bacillus toyonensis]|uniref:hypothetical protein n=1 Tax=Bacillus toyonensis TaxID=155322 RepID=UPI000BEB9990|nr:hypothetical protein [Bacillus toyonensis]PDZ29154.1 hypothetical protein CON85_07985 [Bacillus toyonensis]PHA15513.1 hypothetical protein COE66_07060 [Bacillus toyonensis]